MGKIFSLMIGGIYQMLIVCLGQGTGEPLSIGSQVENPGGCGREL